MSATKLVNPLRGGEVFFAVDDPRQTLVSSIVPIPARLISLDSNSSGTASGGGQTEGSHHPPRARILSSRPVSQKVAILDGLRCTPARRPTS